MVETKTVSRGAEEAPMGRVAPTTRTFSAGYIAPHPNIRKDAVDVDSFLQEHSVYTQPYLDSVVASHRNPTKWHEYIAWVWHVAVRTMVGLLTGSLGDADGLSEGGWARRMLFFSSAGIAGGTAGAAYNHARSVLLNRSDNGWVHTCLANAECVRVHGGILAMVHAPSLLMRALHLAIQAALLAQVLAVYCLAPSVAHAYDAYRAEEQVFNLSQAIRLIDTGRFKRWRAMRAPALAAAYYALPEGATVRDALLRMRADEACIHHLNAVLGDLRPGAKNPFITMERRGGAK